ncbi:uncharacterized protein LOC127568664 isoform X2 [Pristis pectinata]|nr:uncharacterized protein LOC127568664 isoform X2 [Pristis pectinata]XP_051868630.1 uncharacterized protein LOC127568664 isoform X2 [Pristis pectinata]XP_051868631.1 uncharacterized protein LOC127568664 isoform X2 [Pristis pectinata]
MATAEDGVLASMQGALLRHTKAEELRRDSQLLMQPYANWEEFLTPAPTAIAILGQLITISSARDFPVNGHCPERRFQHIKYPESFRACLMQVSNQGWRTFNLAHKNMDQIRLHSQSVPEHTRAAVRTLLQGDRQMLAGLLPRQLGSIRTVAQECGQLAGEVEGAFLAITDLLHELLEACTSAEGAFETEAEGARRALEEAERRRATVEAERTRAEEYFTRMTREVDEAQHSYRSAVERAPSEWGVVGMLAVENSINALGSLVSGFMSVVTADPVSLSTTVVESLANVGNAIAEKVRSKEPAAVPHTPTHSPLSSHLLSSCTQLMVAAVKLQELLTSKGRLSPTTPLGQVTGQAHRIFQRVQEELDQEEEEEEEGSPRQAALALCHRGLGLCQQLEKVGQSPSPSEEQLERAATRIADLYGKVLKFSAGCAASGSPLLPPSAPNLSRATKTQDPEDKSLVQTLVTQARLRVENAKAQLESTRREYQRSFEGLKQSNRELEEIVRRMAQCQVTEVDFGTTLKMLAQGMEALGRVREQWTKMIRFFEMVSNLIHICLSKSLQMFADQSEDAQQLQNYSQQQLVRDLIYTQAFQASNISCLVHMISKTYVDISTNFLMERVTRLGRLITLDPEDPRFLSERQLLQQDCEDARAMIMERVVSSRQEFEGQVQQRIEAIESDLKAALPPASADEQRDIESSLRQQPRHIFQELSRQEEEEQWA